MAIRSVRAGVSAVLAIAVSTIALTGVESPASAGRGHTSHYADPKYSDSATLAVSGTLETAVVESFGSHPKATNRYALLTDEGRRIGLPATFAKKFARGSRFDGELAITGGMANDLRDKGVSVRDGQTIAQSSKDSATASDVAADQAAPVPVASASVTQTTVAPPTPQAHHAYVAVITNRGTVEQDDAEIHALVTDMTSYWVTESDGVISSFDEPGFVKYASSAAPSTSSGCGLDAPGPLWNEASQKFPGVDPSIFDAPGNHLLVFVADDCAGGSVGVGTVGSSLADAGAAIISLGVGTKQIGAHEIGHNLSLEHANLEYCLTSCAVAPYYDAYSVMGFAIDAYPYTPPSLDTTYRDLLSLTSSSEVEDLSLAAAETTATTTKHLQPRGTSSGLRGLRVTDPSTGTTYFVENRSGTDRDSGAFYSGSLASSGGFQLASNIARYGPGIVISQIYTGDHAGNTKVLTRHSGTSFLSSLASGQTFSNASGTVTVTETASSGSLGADISVKLTRPVTSATPSLTGTLRVGRTVSAVPGTWDADTFSYVWKVNGVVIGGATQPQYTISAAQSGKKLSVTVTGAKAGYVSVSRTSPSSTVGPGILHTALPTIVGQAKVGHVLRVYRGAWTAGTTLTQRWYANGQAISGATKTTYTVTKGKRGKRITVRVTGRKYAYLTASRLSARTGYVR